MNCPRCGKSAQVNSQLVGYASNGLPIYHRTAYCPNCLNRWDLDNNIPKEPSFAKGKNSTLSVIACALAGVSFVFPMIIIIGYLLALSGGIIGIIDLSIKEKDKKHLGSWFAIVVLVLWTIVLFSALSENHQSKQPVSFNKPIEQTIDSEDSADEILVSDNEQTGQTENEEIPENTYCQEILFMGFPWGTSFTEIETTHPEFDLWGIAGEGYKTFSVDDIVLGDYEGIDFEYNDINIIGNCDYEKDVAGYIPKEINFYFAYGIVDGVLMQTEEDSKLYGGQYVFETQNIEGMTSDLVEKLSSLYGESDKYTEDNDLWNNYYTYTYWYGENNTMVVLKTLNAEEDSQIYKDQVTISYVWIEGDSLLQEASDYLKIKAKEDEEKIYGNENTSGL